MTYWMYCDGMMTCFYPSCGSMLHFPEPYMAPLPTTVPPHKLICLFPHVALPPMVQGPGDVVL